MEPSPVVWLVVILAVASTSWVRQASADDLTVRLTGLRNETGQMLVGLHSSAGSFPSRWQRAFAVRRVPVGSPVTFEGIPAGRYAVIAVHDEDGDGAMTKTFIGLPVEGFGTSNNPTFFGPPRFGPAVFDLRGSSTIDVRIVYF